MTIDKLVEWATKEADKYHIGCGIKRECNSECGRCTALAILSNPDLYTKVDEIRECSLCHGKGSYSANVAEDRECHKCAGSGKVKIQILIPLAEALKGASK